MQPTGDLTTSSLMKLMFHMPHSIIRTSLREQVSSEFVSLRVLTRSGPDAAMFQLVPYSTSGSDIVCCTIPDQCANGISRDG